MAELARSRRLARELAFQALYTVSVAQTDPDEAVQSMLQRIPMAPEAANFVRVLTEGVLEEELDLDSTISRYLANGWGIDRIAITDHLALKLGAFELMYQPGIPPKVSISEAVNLAAKFGSKESGRFVNGVLAKVYQNSEKVNWDPSQEEFSESYDETEPTGLTLDDEPEEEVIVTEGSEQEQEFKKVKGWVLRTED